MRSRNLVPDVKMCKYFEFVNLKRASPLASSYGGKPVMNVLLKPALFFLICFGLALPVLGQNNPDELKKKVDAIVSKAYGEAAVVFPCRLKTSGRAKMGRWKDVENCVNPAHDQVDWEDHAAALRKIREDERISREDLTVAVEAALTEQTISYDKVFIVKDKREDAVLLPLSNSLLKFLPENSLAGLTLYDKKGDLRGVFVGQYSYERSGGLEFLTGYNMVNFQYTDLNGNITAPGERFLLDSFGVPWSAAKHQPGFRLPSNKLLNVR